MKRSVLAMVIVLSVCASARSQSTRIAPNSIDPDLFTFELTPKAPPVPALKYQLLFGYSDRRPGNAAPLILDAVLLMGPTASDTANKANDAYEAKDFKTFDSLADSLVLTAMWEQLDQALRRLDSDFDSPFREMAERTMLPHLHSIRSIAWIIKARGRRQIEQGKIDDALATIRLGYELGDKVTDRALVSGLVSNGCTRLTNDITAQLMTHPDSPNLYWALVNIPARQPILRRSWDAEHEWLFVGHPRLARVRAGEELTAAEWRTVLTDDLAGFFTEYKGYGEPTTQRPHPDPIKDASPETLRRAQADYVESHHVTAEQAAKTDAAITLGHFYYRQWRIAADDVSKLRGLPYAVALPRAGVNGGASERLKQEQPTNPFLEAVSFMNLAIYQFARADRELAALTAVEALRSYAAAHGGALPERLDQVTDTPVLLNPATGEAFEYRVESGVATIADTKSPSALKYTVKIRK